VVGRPAGRGCMSLWAKTFSPFSSLVRPSGPSEIWYKIVYKVSQSDLHFTTRLTWQKPQLSTLYNNNNIYTILLCIYLILILYIYTYNIISSYSGLYGTYWLPNIIRKSSMFGREGMLVVMMIEKNIKTNIT